VAGWTRGACGFGMGISMNAGVTLAGIIIALAGIKDWSLSMYEVVCLITAIDVSFVPAMAIIWDDIHLHLALILALPRAIFLVLGTFVLLKCKSVTLSMVLGLLVTAFAMWQWLYGTISEDLRKHKWAATQRKPFCFYSWAVVASSVSGVTSGFAGVTSPPVQVLVLLTGMPKASFRATWITVNSILKPLQLILLILLSGEDKKQNPMGLQSGSLFFKCSYFFVVIVCAWTGLMFGDICHRMMSERTARRCLVFLLSVSSVLLLAKAGLIISGIGTLLLLISAFISILGSWFSENKDHSINKKHKDESKGIDCEVPSLNEPLLHGNR